MILKMNRETPGPPDILFFFSILKIYHIFKILKEK